MRVVFMFVLVFSVAVCDIELKLEATDGENVVIPLDTAELERANRVRVTFKEEYEEKARMIVQFCAHGESCRVVETLGVSLNIEQRTLTLQRVSSNNSGLYEAKIITGKVVSEIKVILVVRKPAFSPSRALLHTSTPKPPNSSEHQWLYALLILPASIIIIISGVVVFFYRREREPLGDVEEARETPAVSRPSIFKKNYWKRNCSDCAAVSFKACTEDTDDQLLDT